MYLDIGVIFDRHGTALTDLSFHSIAEVDTAVRTQFMYVCTEIYILMYTYIYI